MGNRRKMYILDVICDRFYFGEVQEEVLGQCGGQGILAIRKEGYLSINGLFQEKETSMEVEECFCKYSTDISRFVLEILEKSMFIASTKKVP